MERERPGFFTRLVEQQTPKYMWIGCSDSRVPANQITGLEPGEVFVHRNVANVVVHSDLNALSAIQFAVEQLKVEHIMVVGHYGCGGVLAALRGTRVGLADNWLRHVQDVRAPPARLDHLPVAEQEDALCELNVIEQVVNVAHVHRDAGRLGRGQKVDGARLGLRPASDGLLKDLEVSMRGTDEVVDVFRHALKRYPRGGAAATVRSSASAACNARKAFMFPQRLDSTVAYDIAKAMMDGFNRHYRLFRTESARAKHRFETADWHGQQRAQRERIEFYDLRVHEALDPAGAASSRPASSRWTSGSRSSCTTSACWSTTTSPSWPRPSSTRSPPRSCTAAISRTTSSSCARPSAPSTSKTTSRRAQPTYRAYYPTQRHPARDAASSWSNDFDLRREFEDLRARRRLRAEAHGRAPGRRQAARQLPDPGAVQPVLPQQGRLRRRQDHQRLQRGAVCAADPAQHGRASW